MSIYTECYFTSSGAYGNMEDVVIIDTSRWSEKDWERIEGASDEERQDIAQIIDDFHNGRF